MSSSPSSSSSSNLVGPLDWILDVATAVDVVLGTTSLTVGECSRLAADSVIRLTQAAGSDLELRIAGLPFAVGEVVIADGEVSLRLSRILPPSLDDLP